MPAGGSLSPARGVWGLQVLERSFASRSYRSDAGPGAELDAWRSAGEVTPRAEPSKCGCADAAVCRWVRAVLAGVGVLAGFVAEPAWATRHPRGILALIAGLAVVGGALGAVPAALSDRSGTAGTGTATAVATHCNSRQRSL